MDSDWVNQRLMILRAADVARDAVKRGLYVPDGELHHVDDVVALVWSQLKRGLQADD